MGTLRGTVYALECPPMDQARATYDLRSHPCWVLFPSFSLQVSPKSLCSVTHKILNPCSSSPLGNADPLENMIKTLDCLPKKSTDVPTQQHRHMVFGIDLEETPLTSPCVSQTCLSHPLRVEY